MYNRIDYLTIQRYISYTNYIPHFFLLFSHCMFGFQFSIVRSQLSANLRQALPEIEIKQFLTNWHLLSNCHVLELECDILSLIIFVAIFSL